MPEVQTRSDSLRVFVGSKRVSDLHAVGTIPGVKVAFVAARNGVGTGAIRSRNGNELSWKAPESAIWGDWMFIPSDGRCLLEDGEDRGKTVRVVAYPDYMSVGAVQANVYLADVFYNGVGFEDTYIDGEWVTGGVSALKMRNKGITVLSQIAVWVDAVEADIEISDDHIHYVSPTSEEEALAFDDLLPNGFHMFYLHRKNAADHDPLPKKLNHLYVRFDG